MVNQTNNVNPSSSGGQPGQAIDKLLDFCVANDGTAYYQVKWKPTWERADALLQFTDLVDSFWAFVNNAHKGNLYNNQSLIQGYPPDLPTSLASNVGTGLVSNLTPSKPKQKKNAKLTPHKQVNAFNPPQKRKPIQTPTKPTIVEAVVIDSDDEDVAEVTSSSLQNVPLSQSMTMFQGQQLQPPNYSSASSIWNMNMQTKTEPADIPDQKPFQQQNHLSGVVNDFNQPHQIGQTPAIPQSLSQQQFPFPAQNTKPVSSSRGRGGGGRGRGRGAVDPGTKRKLDRPDNNPNQHLQQVKFESLDDATTLTQSNENFGNSWESPQGYDNESLQSDENGGKWENSFEIIEKKNFDGTSLETQYKCTICGTVISNKSSCRRHYNIHSGQKSHKCPICDKAFHRMDYMQRHLKVHGQGGGKELEGLIKLAMEGVKK